MSEEWEGYDEEFVEAPDDEVERQFEELEARQAQEARLAGFRAVIVEQHGEHYAERLLAFAAAEGVDLGVAGEAVLVRSMHDKWCPLLESTGKHCTCDVEFAPPADTNWKDFR